MSIHYLQKASQKYNILAHCLNLIGEQQQALQCLDEALKLDPNHQPSLSLKGNIIQGQSNNCLKTQTISIESIKQF
ncbi:unnamed protein product [Paramecium sonneborni]|uniref:Tetratricopeptide repeat protein n=1 Tax=Paramecium sonneborni TaxID=65129 RepID=A0A8S1RDR7_9CILI|nr:unnamed protein product [Paramecium sonneborni]